MYLVSFHQWKHNEQNMNCKTGDVKLQQLPLIDGLN